MSHLPAVEGGNGFAARPHLSHADGRRRRRNHQRNLGKPFRCLPRMHGLHDGVPFRRRLWKTDRSYAGTNRTALPATRRGEAVSSPAAKHFYPSKSVTCVAAAFAPVPRGRAPDTGAPRGYPKKNSRPVAGHGGVASASTASGNTS